MRRATKRLGLSRETLASLDRGALDRVAGGNGELPTSNYPYCGQQSQQPQHSCFYCVQTERCTP